jgi:hypothetical protein
MTAFAIARSMSNLPAMTPDQLRDIRAELGHTQAEAAVRFVVQDYNQRAAQEL